MSYFKCKDVSRLASESQDRKLGLLDRIGMAIHLWICKPCENYHEHIKFLRKAAKQAEPTSPAGTNLGEDARERIRNKLAGHTD